MARLPRFFLKDQPLHVIQRGNNRTPIFVIDDDRSFFLLCLQEGMAEYGVHIHAFELMTNHVHILATPASEQSLPRLMQSVGCRYVQYFNRQHGRTGTLWEGRYRATLVDTDRYFLVCMVYIEFNSVRAGMVAKAEDYAWSSYRANALGHDDPLVTPHPVYLELGQSPEARRAAYRQLFRRPLLSQDVEAIRRCTNRAWALGGQEFGSRVEALGCRRARPLRELRSGSRPPCAGGQTPCTGSLTPWPGSLTP